jgi:selenocysteine-specific elongation factor
MSAVRKNIMLGTAGHVDHGKTALVKMLTGCETDTLAEEKQRGLTIDLGFAPCRLADERIVGVVDVPGHVDFIRNMVAGAHGIDVVIFVVAADDGIMPQTHEHLHILTLMGLRHGLVALTKVDLVDEARRSFVIQDLRRLLAGTFLANAPICPLSTITGEGFEAFFDALNEVTNACAGRPGNGLFHLWVEDVFTIHGAGAVVTGIPTHGRVRLNDRLCVLPGEHSGRVRRLQVYGDDAEEGRAGECVAINLAEMDHHGIRRGMVLCEPETLSPSGIVEAELQLLPAAKGEWKDFSEVHLHIGTAATLARVAMLEHPMMSAGQKQMVQLRLPEPLCIMPGERFVIRANTKGAGQSGLITIGGGRILGIGNARLRRNKPWVLDALAARKKTIDDPAAWCEVVLKQSGKPLSLPALSKACLLRAEEAEQIITALRATGRVAQTTAGNWIHEENIESAGRRIVEAVEKFHGVQPKRLGMETKELQAVLNLDGSAFEMAVELLIEQRRIERHASVLALAGWKARVSSDEEALAGQIATVLQKARWTVPPTAELAAAISRPQARVEALLRLLAEQGVVVKLGDGLFMHRDAIAAAREVAAGLFTKGPSFSTMDFRDALGVSRKYAVPVLDYLDAIRFTVRNGNQRTPGAEAKKVFGNKTYT